MHYHLTITSVLVFLSTDLFCSVSRNQSLTQFSQQLSLVVASQSWYTKSRNWFSRNLDRLVLLGSLRLPAYPTILRTALLKRQRPRQNAQSLVEVNQAILAWSFQNRNPTIVQYVYILMFNSKSMIHIRVPTG